MTCSNCIHYKESSKHRGICWVDPDRMVGPEHDPIYPMVGWDNTCGLHDKGERK